MTHRPQFISLSPELARALVTELQTVLDVGVGAGQSLGS